MGLNLAKVDVYYACLINANDQMRIMISKLSTKLVPGCYNPTPLKESRPEIRNERLSREEEQSNHQKRQDAVIPGKTDVDGRSRHR